MPIMTPLPGPPADGASTVDPAASLVLLKAENVMPHGGGKVVQPDSAEHETLLAWLKEGAVSGAQGIHANRYSRRPAERTS